MTHLSTAGAASTPVVIDGWQDRAIPALTALLHPEPSVRALAVFGTAAQTQSDLWSDVDLLLVVEDGAKGRFHPGMEWLWPLGDLFAWDQSGNEWFGTTRACFTDFRRVDFVVVTEGALAQIDRWPQVPFWKGTRVLFSRSAIADGVLARSFATPRPPLISPEEFERLVNGFWFKGMLAVQKVMRDDRLIALHLALERVQECAVLGMLLRDRAEGTAHHRHGGRGNAVAEQLAAALGPPTAAGILDSLEQSSMAFDALARQWSPEYRERRHPLRAWIARARQALKEDPS